MKKKLKVYAKKRQGKQIKQKSNRSKIYFFLALLVVLIFITLPFDKTYLQVPFFPNTGTAVAPSGTVSPLPTSIPPATPTLDTHAPTAPINFVVNSPTQVTLSWAASTDNVGVTRYDIFRNDNYFTSTSGTSITITGLTPSTTYTFFVKAKDAAGNNSGGSTKVTFTTSSSK